MGKGVAVYIEHVPVVSVYPTKFGLVAGKTLGIMFGVREMRVCTENR